MVADIPRLGSELELVAGSELQEAIGDDVAETELDQVEDEGPVTELERK